MDKYIVQLVEKRQVAEGTTAFYFSRPEGFTYIAGQFIDLILVNSSQSDADSSSHTFSLASAPHEKYLMIATRVRPSAFKQALDNTLLGSEVEITEASGSFTVPADSHQQSVFLIGGIGITPVRSIILDAVHKKSKNALALFYSNRRPEDAAFLEELKHAKNQLPDFTFVPTMTQMQDSKAKWQGETGYVSMALIEKYIRAPLEARYYIAGPFTMVAAMRGILSERTIDDENIVVEEFPGY